MREGRGNKGEETKERKCERKWERKWGRKRRNLGIKIPKVERTLATGAESNTLIFFEAFSEKTVSKINTRRYD
jgi:hypothetical protein